MNYALVNHYAGLELVNGFNWWDSAVNGSDPSNGYV